MSHQLKDKLQNIRCLISDVDGVLSNGLLYLSNHGDEIKTFHVHDGVGLKLIMNAKIHVAIITTSKNKIIDNRMQQLNIEHYFSGELDKRNAYNQLKAQLKLKDNQFAYIGDDLPDLPILKQVGFKVAVADARPEVLEIADFITQNKGGHGAVREVCDLLLACNNKQQIALENYLNEIK